MLNPEDFKKEINELNLVVDTYQAMIKNDFSKNELELQLIRIEAKASALIAKLNEVKKYGSK